MYDKFMKNATLLAKNQEYVSRKCEKSYFSTKPDTSQRKFSAVSIQEPQLTST